MEQARNQNKNTILPLWGVTRQPYTQLQYRSVSTKPRTQELRRALAGNSPNSLAHPQSDPKTGTSRRAAKPADEKRRKKHTDKKEVEGDGKRSKDLGPALTLNLSSEPGKLQGQQLLGIGVPHRDHFSSHGKSHLSGCVLVLVPFNERFSQYPLTRGAFHRLKSTSDIRNISNSDPEKQTRESMKMIFPEGGLGAERESSQKVDLKNL